MNGHLRERQLTLQPRTLWHGIDSEPMLVLADACSVLLVLLLARVLVS